MNIAINDLQASVEKLSNNLTLQDWIINFNEKKNVFNKRMFTSRSKIVSCKSPYTSAGKKN